MAGNVFGIRVEIDPSRARSGASAIEKQLDALGSGADRAKKKIDAMTTGAAYGVKQLVNPFAALTEQFRKEAEMLDRIHGPMMRHAQDLRTLEALYRKGAISAKELANAQRNMGSAPRGLASRGGGGGADDAANLAGSVPGIGGFASSAAVPAAAIAGTLALGKLGDSYQQLENKLRVVTGSEDELAAAMARSKDIANATYQPTEDVAAAYSRMRLATEQMGLSSGTTWTLTENLSKAVRASGASASESSAGVQQFVQALQSGRLQGDEFRSINENLPAVMDVLSKSLGVTRGELRQMATDGKLTGQVMADAFTKTNAGLDEMNTRLTKMRPTMSQNWQATKNDISGWLGKAVSEGSDWYNRDEIDKLTNLRYEIEKANKAMVDLVATTRERRLATDDLDRSEDEKVRAGIVVKAIEDEIAALGSLGYSADATAVKTFLLRQEQKAATDEMNTAKFAATGFTETLGGLSGIIGKVKQQLAGDTWGTTGLLDKAVDGWNKAAAAAKRHANDLSREQKLLKEIQGPLKEYTANTATLENLFARGRITAAQYEAQLRKLADAYGGSELRALLDFSTKPQQMISTAGGNISRSEFDARQADEDALLDIGLAREKQYGAPDEPDLEKDLAAFEKEQERVTELTKKWNDELNALHKELPTVGDTIQASLVDVLGAANEQLFNLVNQGEFSWDAFADNAIAALDRLAIKLLEMALLQAALGIAGANTPAGGIIKDIGGAIFGGGFAGGGSYVVPGSGAPDSRRVLFNVSPGERIDFTPRGGGGGGSSNVTVVNKYNNDELLAALDSPAGERTIMNAIRRNPSAVRSWSGSRN